MEKQSVQPIVDHFFRNEFGKAVSILTNRFGPQQLENAEDAVQEALVKAMQTWKFGQIPDNPSGWIIRVAQNKLIDQLRKSQKVYYATQLPDSTYETPIISEEEFNDDMTRMIFACCNPRLSQEHQLILTLKILGGLSIREIASALLKKEETIAKSYTRAKKKFKQENLNLDLPTKGEIQPRLNNVLKAIYLLFNEGYKTTEGEHLIRKELCEEAMRLNAILLDNPTTNNDFSRSLMALMHFQVSRFDARVASDGISISLEYQNRNKWDQKHINLGNRYLSTIHEGMQNPYFIQAAINGIHCAAKNYKETNWGMILTLYNHLYSINPNPIVALNRIYPMLKVHGFEQAMNEIHMLKEATELFSNHLLPATEAELLIHQNQREKAIAKLKEAKKLAQNACDQQFYQQKTNNLLKKKGLHP